VLVRHASATSDARAANPSGVTGVGDPAPALAQPATSSTQRSPTTRRMSSRRTRWAVRSTDYRCEMTVERHELPGIGVSHVLTTGRGRRIGVVVLRTGRRDLVIYDKADPDTSVVSVALSGDEANALAELLGTARIVERLAELQRQVEGLVTEQLVIAPGSPYDGKTLGDTRARTRSGASIVAVVRDREVIASPRPDFGLRSGDLVVVVGTEGGVGTVASILADG